MLTQEQARALVQERLGIAASGEGRIAAMGPVVIESDGDLLAVPLAGGAQRARTAQ